MAAVEWLFWFLVPVVPFALAVNGLVLLAGLLLPRWLERASSGPGDGRTRAGSQTVEP
ncbi:MAG: hypothetical protein QJR08_05745 [Bacillota bacterium]|nr:hypothetical protein [Bacillota bacterium]